MNNWTTIKNDFGTIHLLDIFEAILFFDKNHPVKYGGEKAIAFSKTKDYASLIKTTTLTKGMFTGDKAIFKGFKKETRKGYGLKFDGQGYSVRFYHRSPFVQVSIMYSKDEYEEIGEAMFLTDLATVTAKKPMELC